MNLKKNYSLLKHNTLGIQAESRFWVDISTLSDFEETRNLPEYSNFPVMVLGGGSNVLFTKNWEGWILNNSIFGKEVLREDENQVFLEIGGGENWHELVRYCIDRNWGGIENLSLIPGKVGAAPIQNIGAYGVELKDLFVELETVDLISGEIEKYDHAACHFGYRDSIFKRELKGKKLISKVVLKLQKNPVLNTSYGAVLSELKKLNHTDWSIKDISDIIVKIRLSKLPDPAEIGNAGSFFKNPTVSNEVYNSLKIKNPNLPGYPVGDSHTKLAAGWLIEQAGWKGKRFGECGVHEKQALVLVNYGNARGVEILELSEKVQAAVREKFGIELEREVNVI